MNTVRFLLVILVSIAVTACGGGSGNTPAPTLANITAQPADQSVVEGNTATFSVTASNAVNYQWQISTDGGATFTDIVGATAASYTTPTTTIADSGKQYRVVASRSSNSVTSSAATLTVTAAPIAPAITVQPSNQTVIENQNASFSVTATGTSLAYQWQRSTDNGANFTDLAGETSATLTRTSVLLTDNGQQFRVVVTNVVGSITSNAATLTVNTTPVIPAFTTQPANQSVTEPATASFSVIATGTPAPTLQWQSSTDGATWNDIVGETGGSYTTPATTVADSGKQYRAVATNSAGTTNSNAATLTVAPTPVVPSFTAQPANQSVTEPNTATFSVTAAGVPTPNLQWELSTDNGANWSNITGATAASYTTPATTVADSGKQYRAVATNSAGITNSNAATLTVLQVPCVACKIFITAAKFDGNALGGVKGADQLCMQDANYPGTAVYKAFLVANTGNANTSRIASISPNAGDGQIDWVLKANTSYYQVDGTTLVMSTNANAIFDFTKGALTNPFHNKPDWMPFHTGMSMDWQIFSWAGTDFTCSGWQPGPTMSSVYGYANDTSFNAIAAEALACNEMLSGYGHLACIEQ